MLMAEERAAQHVGVEDNIWLDEKRFRTRHLHLAATLLGEGKQIIERVDFIGGTAFWTFIMDERGRSLLEEWNKGTCVVNIREWLRARGMLLNMIDALRKGSKPPEK